MGTECLYIYTHVSVWIYGCMCACVLILACIYVLGVCVFVCVSVCTCDCAYAGVCKVCVCLFLNAQVGICLCVDVHVCVLGGVCACTHRTKDGKKWASRLRVISSWEQGEAWKSRNFHLDFHFSFFKHLDLMWLLFMCFQYFQGWGPK